MVENTAEQMDNLLDAEGRRRRKDRPVVKKERHPLETVPFFDRPMGASIRDVQVGEDDIGNPVFKTKLGDTYTVRLNPDQRNLRAKIVEDFIPAAQEYLKDPKLPTKEQTVGAAKAVAEGVKETVSIPKDLLTGKKSAVDVTMGDVADIATMTSLGASAFSVPEDSLRMASVSGMFGRKKTPVEEYLAPVEVDLDESKLVDLIDEDAKKFKLFNPRLQNEFNLTYNDVIKQEFKPLKFDETGGRRSTLIDPEIHGNNRLKSYVSRKVLDRYTSLMDDSKVIKSMEFNPAGKEKSLNEVNDWLKITTDMTSNQVKKQFNRFLTEQPGLVLKLSAANKLKKKYEKIAEEGSWDEVVTNPEKLRSADNLQQVTIAEILDRFFDEAVVYTPDPGKIFKDRKFTFKVTDVDETGAQIQREVSPNFSGAFKDEGWDYGVYNFDTIFGDEGLENTFRDPLTRALVMEFDDKVIDPKTKVTYVGERRMLEGEDLTPAETSPEGFDTEVTFQDIVDSIDKKLVDKREVVEANTGRFKNLGVEILTDFLDKKTGDPYNLDEEKLSETVLGADLLKLLENDPRMNVKNIPEFMKTQEFKNRKITLRDVGEEIIDDFDAATFNVKASPLTTPRYAHYQLQADAGFEGGAYDKTYEVPVYSRLGTGQEGTGYSAKKQHYSPDTLSHVRFTVYEPSRAVRITDQDTGLFDRLTEDKDGISQDFILVEELQSDLISGGIKKFKKIPYTEEKTKKVIDATIFNAKDLFPEASTYLKSYSDNLAKDMTEFFDRLDNQPPVKGEAIPVPDPDKVYAKLSNEYTERIQKDVADGKISLREGDDAQELLNQILTYVQEPGYFASESKYILGNKNITQQRAINKDARRNPEKFGSPPIKKNIEAVELNIQTLINQANDMGIDKIVFPSFDMIAARRFRGDELKAAINNKSIKRDLEGNPIYDNDGNPVLIEGNALYRNYVTDFNKALNKFKTEYPEIKIETGVELPYKPYAGTEDLRTDGVVIDISGMKEVYDLEKPKFAKGGVTMKDQMEMAFMQEGGLKDDGMDIDPVSGNEVPPGSMAREVRDDIPAQLSEGEYVVPADVVQYYGVKFFEDLRMEAKRGLADMEANGRIGGEPVDMPMDMPMDDTPTVAVSTGGYIDGIPAAEYNVGGMASNLYNNPTQMDQEVNNIISTMYNNPQVMDELARRGIQVNRTQAQMMPQQMNQANPPSQARMGFNPGGLTSNEAAAYNYITSPTIPGQMFQTPGASYIYAAPPQMTTTAAGVDSSVPSVENCNKMGMDYDPIAKICVPREVTQVPQAGGRDDDDGGPDLPEPKPWYDNVNWEDPTAQMNTFFGKEGKIGSAIAGVAGSVIGGPLVGGAMTFGAKVGNLAQSRAMVNVYKAMGLDDEASLIEKQIEDQLGGSKALSMADQTINKFVGSDGDIYTIQAFKAAGIDIPRGLRDDELQDYLDQIGEKDRRLLRNKYAPNYKAPAAKATATGPVKTSKDITSAADIKQRQEKRSKEKSAASIAAQKAGQAAIDKAKKDRPTGAIATSQKIQDTMKKSKEELESQYGFGLQKGGLMSKKKK